MGFMRFKELDFGALTTATPEFNGDPRWFDGTKC